MAKFSIDGAKIKKWFFIILAIILVISGIAFAGAYNANYSKGYRAGKIMKFSKRGVFVKTHEGQLDKGGIHTSKDGDLTSTWAFSVDSDQKEIIKILEEVATTGERVNLDYEEKYYKFGWRGDTKYFVTGVRREVEKKTSTQDNLENMMDKGRGTQEDQEDTQELDKEKIEQEIRKEIKLREELKEEIKNELKEELKEELKKELLEELKSQKVVSAKPETVVQ